MGPFGLPFGHPKLVHEQPGIQPSLLMGPLGLLLISMGSIWGSWPESWTLERPFWRLIGSLLGTQNWSMNSLEYNRTFEWVPGAPFHLKGPPWPNSWTLERPFRSLTQSTFWWVFVLERGRWNEAEPLEFTSGRYAVSP